MRSARCGCADRTVRFAALALAVMLPAGHAAAQTAEGTPAEDAAPAAPASLSASIGASVWTGDFGADSNTTIRSALLGVRYQTGGLRLTANIPQMRIRSRGSFFAGIDGTPLFVAPGIAPARRTRSGLGDMTLGAAYLLPNGQDRGFDVELTGKIKIPTASDSSQLSTGKVDYAVGAGLSKTIGRFTPAVTVTYRIYGDNRTWQFRDGANITAGTTYFLNDSTVLVVDYDYVRGASRLIADGHAGVLGLSTRLTRRLRVTGYASKGFSDGAAAFSGGASVSVNF